MYNWQIDVGCTGTWVDIPGANSTSYTPISPASTSCYRRKVTDDNLCEAFTGAKTFEIYPDLVSQDIVPSPSNPAVCAGILISATFSGGSGGFPGAF